MPNELYIFTTPTGATVVVKPDSEPPFTAQQSSDTGRADEQKIEFPESLARQGAELTVTADGHDAFSGRGLLQPQMICPNCGTVVASECFFGFNDVHLKPTAVAPPVTPPVTGNTPLEVITGVYATGAYDLSTKAGCGGFTEECCRQLASRFGPQWGHIAKSPGQNQWNQHAVDALYALYGSDAGVWDIIQNSVSTSAKPAFNSVGEGNPEEWRPPSPLPVQPMGTATRDVDVALTLSLADFIRLLAWLRVI